MAGGLDCKLFARMGETAPIAPHGAAARTQEVGQPRPLEPRRLRRPALRRALAADVGAERHQPRRKRRSPSAPRGGRRPGSGTTSAWPSASPSRKRRRWPGRQFFEYGRHTIDVWKLRSEAFVPRITTLAEDARILERVRRGGRGFLLVTGHVGNWEMGAVTLRAHGLVPAVVGQPELDPNVQEMRQKLRERLGVESIDIGSSMSTAFRVRTAVGNGAAPSRSSSTGPTRRTRSSCRSSAGRRRFCAHPRSWPDSAAARSCRASSCGTPTAATSTSGASRSRPIRASPPTRTPPGSCRRVAADLERVIRLHPTQWFNFYRFWDGLAS